jgi:hypothetical protein
MLDPDEAIMKAGRPGGIGSNVTGTKGGGAGWLARLSALGSATGGLSTRVSAATAVATGSCLMSIALLSA